MKMNEYEIGIVEDRLKQHVAKLFKSYRANVDATLEALKARASVDINASCLRAEAQATAMIAPLSEKLSALKAEIAILETAKAELENVPVEVVKSPWYKRVFGR